MKRSKTRATRRKLVMALENLEAFLMADNLKDALTKRDIEKLNRAMSEIMTVESNMYAEEYLRSNP